MFPSWNELPSELKRVAMLAMEPRILANKCLVDKSTLLICNSEYFWREYFAELSNHAVNNTIMELAQQNQGIIEMAYRAADDSIISAYRAPKIIELSTIGTLMIFSAMRRDEYTLSWLNNEYKKITNKYIPITHFYNLFSAKNKLIKNLKSGEDVIRSVEYFFDSMVVDAELLFIVYPIIERVGHIRTIAALSEILRSKYIQKFIIEIIKAYCYYQELDNLVDLINMIISGRYLIREYASTIANHLSVKLYGVIEQAMTNYDINVSLIEYLTCAMDKEHLIAAFDGVQTSCKLFKYFEPMSFVKIVKEMDLDNDAKYAWIYDYASTAPRDIADDIRRIWKIENPTK